MKSEQSFSIETFIHAKLETYGKVLKYHGERKFNKKGTYYRRRGLGQVRLKWAFQYCGGTWLHGSIISNRHTENKVLIPHEVSSFSL